MSVMKRRGFTAMLGASALAAPGILRKANAAAPLKAGFVYIGPVGDYGWSYQQNIGRLQAQKALGDSVQTTYVENIPGTPECEAVFESLVASGHELIFGTSFDYMNYMVKVAAKYPHVKFEHCTGYKQAPNLAVYDIRYYEGRYIQGVIAGHVSKTGKVGYVASVPIPEVVRGMDAVMLGMRSVNPKAELKFIMIDNWYDPGKEGEATKALIDQGCDVICQHTDSPAPLETAASLHIPAFGQATDMIKFAPHTQLSASVNEWGGYYTKRMKAVLDNTWSSTNTWGGFADGMLSMAPYTNMPAATAAVAAQAVADIKSGKINVFAGPLVDQTGKTFLPAGQVLAGKDLVGLQTLVQGVNGKLG